MWSLVNDATGKVLAAGTESEVKARYLTILTEGSVAEMNLFIEENASGDQYALNTSVTPPYWEEI